MSDETLINVELEAEFLGLLMQENKSIDTALDLVDAEDFGEPAHGRIFAAIAREASLGRPANPVTLKAYFDADEAIKSLGGAKYIFNITAHLSMTPVRPSAERIRDLAQRRRMRGGLIAAADACLDHESTTAEIINFADNAITQNGKDEIHQPTGGECFDELINGFGEGDYGVTCGIIPDLDEAIGALRPGQMVIVAGRPGMGKSSVAVSYALGAAQNGHGVLFATLEMSSRELAGRMAADMCYREGKGIPYGAIRKGSLDDWQRKQVARAGQHMCTLPFQVVEKGNLTTGRLNMLIRRHKRRMEAKGQKLELVVVDYLQLMRPDRRGSKYEDVSEVSMALKAMAMDHGVAIMALAQLSRLVEQRPDKRPQLSDLRDSGQIEQDADVVLFLLREEYYLRLTEPDESDPKRAGWEASMDTARNRIEFIVAKRRNGETGTAIGQFHGAFQAVRGFN